MHLAALFTTSHDGTPEQRAELGQRYAGRLPDPEMAAGALRRAFGAPAAGEG